MEDAVCDLTHCFLCRSCMPEWKDIIALKKKTIALKKGKHLFLEGEKVKGMYFMYEGSVKVHKQWIDNKELIIRFAKSGDIVGHRGLGGGETYPISATALEDSKACFITNDFLEVTLKTNPAFTYRLMHLYAKELQKAEERMRSLAHMEVKGRIAGALLEIAGFFGLNKEKYIAVKVTRQDIASYAGTTYETVFKFFTELIHSKVIFTDGKSIRINNPDKLKQLVN